MFPTCLFCGIAHPIPSRLFSFFHPQAQLTACLKALALQAGQLTLIVAELPGATSATKRVQARILERAKPFVGVPVGRPSLGLQLLSQVAKDEAAAMDTEG